MKRTLLSAALALSLCGSATAQTDWLHIYQHNNKISTEQTDLIRGITYTPSEGCDTMFEYINVTTDSRTLTLPMSQVDSVVLGTNIPTMYIDIANGAEVVQKDVYLDASVKVLGWGAYDDFEPMDVTIKGRGNSTWNMQKKPYRLKFKKKQSICGMTKSKNYVLLANYIDCTLMRNSFALQMGQMIGLPYTNHFIPVNLVINGTYRGSYLMTEKIGINGASVDIDETKGILFELDTNYDEPYKFHSDKFRLPVMVKDPDFDELAEDDPSMSAYERMNLWRQEFHNMENTLSTSGEPSADFASQMDIESLARYLMVFAVCGNNEPHHPKSVYLYKEEPGVPFKMGPIWDFDWAFTFNDYEGAGYYNLPLFNGYTEGSNFFRAMMRSPEFVATYDRLWNEFKQTTWPELKVWMDEYADLIEVSAAQNGEIWNDDTYSGKYDGKIGSTDKFRDNYKALLDWLDKRVEWLDNAPNRGLY